MSNFAETLAYVQDWARRTDQILLNQFDRYGIGVTDELAASVRSKVYELAGEQIRYDLSFLVSGRFRDMNVGRPRAIETRDLAREQLQARGYTDRKPAKWYSKPFYGRLNALSGVVSASLVEKAIKVVSVLRNSE